MKYETIILYEFFIVFDSTFTAYYLVILYLIKLNIQEGRTAVFFILNHGSYHISKSMYLNDSEMFLSELEFIT